jgi:hypothetical protein
MATIQQIEANRLNAQKSTGPRSVEGKAVSRFNATKTGIDAKSQIIRGEDPAELDALTAEYQERWHPATPEQRLLVDILIHDEWLLRRFRRVDAEIFECGMQDAWTPKKDCPAGQAFGRGANTFSRLQRRIDSTERSYLRALKELQRLESERRDQASEASQSPGPRPPAPDPASSESPELASFRNLAFEDADAPATPDSSPEMDQPGGAGASAGQPSSSQPLSQPISIPS